MKTFLIRLFFFKPSVVNVYTPNLTEIYLHKTVLSYYSTNLLLRLYLPNLLILSPTELTLYIVSTEFVELKGKNEENMFRIERVCSNQCIIHVLFYNKSKNNKISWDLNFTWCVKIILINSNYQKIGKEKEVWLLVHNWFSLE